jgi:hypothetical protein
MRGPSSAQQNEAMGSPANNTTFFYSEEDTKAAPYDNRMSKIVSNVIVARDISNGVFASRFAIKNSLDGEMQKNWIMIRLPSMPVSEL